MQEHHRWWFKAMLALAALLLILPASTATSCQTTLKDTRLELSTNLLCANDGFHLLGRAELNCNGRMIRGSGTGVGLSLSGNDNIVTNCVLSGFDTGMLLNQTRSATLSSITISRSSTGLLAFLDIETALSSITIHSNTIGAYLDQSGISVPDLTLESNDHQTIIIPRRAAPSSVDASLSLPHHLPPSSSPLPEGAPEAVTSPSPLRLFSLPHYPARTYGIVTLLILLAFIGALKLYQHGTNPVHPPLLAPNGD